MWEFHDAHLLLCSSSFAFSSCHWSYFITSLLTPTSQMATKPAFHVLLSRLGKHRSRRRPRVPSASTPPKQMIKLASSPTNRHTMETHLHKHIQLSLYLLVISISMCVLREEMTTWKLSQLLFSPAVDRNKRRVEWKCEGMRTTRGW